MSKTTLYFFADKLPPKHYGGVEIHGQAFIDYFSNNNDYDLIVISKDVKNRDIMFDNKGLVNIYSLAYNMKTIFFFNSGYWIEELTNLRIAYPDVKFMYRTGGNEILAAKLSDDKPYKYRLNYWVDTLNSTINYLITNSLYTERRLSKIGINEVIMHKVVGGVNRTEIQYNKLSNHRPIAVSVTRFVEYKGINDLVTIFKELPYIDLYVFGDGPLFNEISNQVRNIPNIYLEGKKPNHEVLNYIGNADVYVQCSKDYKKRTGDSRYIHTEGMGRSILEAISLKVPIVVYNSGALSEIVSKDVGVLIEQGEINHFRKAVDSVIKSRDSYYSKTYDKYYFDIFFKEYELLFNMKKVIILTSKFPFRFNDIDGGNLLVDKLISILKDKCVLDICFTRNQKTNQELEVRKIIYLPNKISESNKFYRRIKNYKQNSTEISKLIRSYDKVIMIHASKAFGLDENNLKNVIMFPMFLGDSYLKSNEVVPQEYLNLEKKYLSNLSKILTPSKSEMNQLIEVYGVKSGIITIVPRGIDKEFKRKIRDCRPNQDIVMLLYIGSIKKQKNTIEALGLIEKLRKQFPSVCLTIVGKIQDEVYNKQVESYIEKYDLGNNIKHYVSLNKTEINDLIQNADICISTSLWETFGRGVVEAAFTGIPTIAFKEVECYRDMFEDNKGVLLINNIEEMQEKIEAMIEDNAMYHIQSKRGIESTNKFDSSVVDELLVEEILGEIK